jgi:hypothetical protein
VRLMCSAMPTTATAWSCCGFSIAGSNARRERSWQIEATGTLFSARSKGPAPCSGDSAIRHQALIVLAARASPACQPP